MNYEAMKAQTFGVEIEMNHITRKKAAIIAAGFFGTNNYEYKGGGYDKWVAYDENHRVWQFESDSSIHGPSEEKTELVTPILHYEDIETLQELVRILRKAGAVSNPQQGCGVHIHVGAEWHTPKTLRNLVNIMAAHEEILIHAISIAESRTSTYCKTTSQSFLKRLNEKKPTTMAELADIWYTENNGRYDRTAHYNNSRYHMLNLHATFTKGTVEFRLFQFNNPGHNFKGGLHAGQLKSYIQLCLAMNQAAKEAKNASPKKLDTDNEKYAMRCWLLRLGFIGDEFKTARDMLTRRLTGDAAFRHGRPAA